MKKLLPKCPRCQTEAYVVPAAYGERSGTTLGGAIGLGLVIGGVQATQTMAQTVIRSSLPVIAGTVFPTGGFVISSLAKAASIILACSTIGGTIGAEADQHVFRLYRCNRCGFIVKS